MAVLAEVLMMRPKKSVILIILVLVGVISAQSVTLAAQPMLTTRIKDIARLQGVRNNQLNGVGLVVGLNGTGDSSKANAQLVANTLAKWGIQVNVGDLKVKNVAAVILTATLPPYMQPGETIDIQVASMGDAKSLQGGILLQSPLTGADGKVYAVAQGSVFLGGNTAGGSGAAGQKNITTVGIVPAGAIVERAVPMQFETDGKIRWILNKPDFTTVSRLARTINENIAMGVARAVDMSMVEVVIPYSYREDPVSFVAEVETLPITPDGIAKVLVNERTGTIVIGEKVKIATVAVTHRNITVSISNESEVTQPQPFTDGRSEQTGNLIVLPPGTNIGTIVRALNMVGSTPQDIIAILVAIRDAGALYGVLEFN
jgi:flagellar P-ring protein precursor FlgI